MCGITGWALLSSFNLGEQDLTRMRDIISHRGPDDKGNFIGNTKDELYQIAIGHRRLSIIDLDNGMQPMQTDDGAYTISFNGEIYNYKELKVELESTGVIFSTNSDTEVLLKGFIKWRGDIVKKLNGQFAFVVWDSLKEELFIARDQYGIKPFYYKIINEGLIYSSEIKAIIEITKGEKINHNIIPSYYIYRYAPSPETMFEGIYKFPPGNTGIWNPKNGLKIRPYFSPFDSLILKKTKRFYGVNEFMNIFEDAVKIRMNSDVPFGTFLSGGLDSSSILAMMAKNTDKEINSFSVGFNEQKYSEIEHARLVSEHFGSKHHELILESEQLIKYLPELVRFRDAPVSEPSDIPIYLLAKRASKDVKMVLTGEGADEFLGGYEKHFLENYSKIYRDMVSNNIHSKIILPIFNKLPLKYWRWKLALEAVGLTNRDERYARWFGTMNYEECQHLLHNRGIQKKQIMGIDSNQNSKLRNILCFDQTSWLPDNLLERGDRMTMAASVEARMPFMDVKLNKFVSNLPDNRRLKRRVGKHILRQGMKEILPKSILKRPKVGFKVPVNEWFKGPLYEWLHDLLLSDESINNKYCKKTKLEKILIDHKSGKRNNEKILWTMASLEIFNKEYKDNFNANQSFNN